MSVYNILRYIKINIYLPIKITYLYITFMKYEL